jgi:ArsR family transcriptional regulator
MTNAAKLAETFNLLSVEARVRILQLLKNNPHCVTELTSKLGISSPATSQHLRLLRNAGLVKTIKRGTFVYYLLEEKEIARIKKSTNELLKIK